MKFIYNGNSNKSGVYKIINIQNGRMYIGSAKRFKTRAQQHLSSLRNNRHQNKFLQNDFNKRGEDTFEFHVVEAIEGSEEKRRKQEQKYINEQIDNDNWKNCYNSAKKTINKQGPWSYTPEETKRKMSEFRKGKTPSEETKQRMSESAKNIWEDPEYRKKRSGKNSSMFGKTHSEKTKKKISKASKEKWNTQEFKEQFSKAVKEYYKNNPEAREKASQTNSGENNPFYGKTHSEKIRKKMSKALRRHYKNNPEAIEAKSGKNNPFYGKKHSIKTKQKMSEAHSGENNPNYGKELSQEVKNRISEANAKTYDIQLLSPDKKRYGPITNLAKFCRKHNLNDAHIYSVIKGKRPHHKGWTLVK